MPRTPGPNSHHLYGVQGISQWQGSRSLFLSTQGPPVLPHLLIPEKLKSFRSVVGVDGLAPTPQITKPLSCTLQNTPFSHSFLVLPNCPTPILGKTLLSKFKAFLTVPNLSPDMAWLLLLEPTISSPPSLPSSSVNPIVWDTDNPSSASHHTPIYICLKDPTKFPNQPQYPISQIHQQGLKSNISKLLCQGLLCPTHSPYNTPILLVKKPNGSYHLGQELTQGLNPDLLHCRQVQSYHMIQQSHSWAYIQR